MGGKRVGSSLRQCWRCTAGTTAIEFAIIAPVLFLMLGAICEVGIFLLIQNSVQAATENAARQIRLGKVGPVSVGGTQKQMDIAQFKAVICAKLVVTSCASRIRVDVQSANSFAALADKMPHTIAEVGPQDGGSSYAEVFDPGAPGKQGSLIVTYDWNFVFPMLAPLFGNVGGYPTIRRLYGVSVFENES